MASAMRLVMTHPHGNTILCGAVDPPFRREMDIRAAKDAAQEIAGTELGQGIKNHGFLMLRSLIANGQ